MEDNTKQIQAAFYNILENEYTDADIQLILAKRDEIFTQENRFDVVDILSKGRNSYDIFLRLTDAERVDAVKSGFAYCEEGKLIDLLNLNAEECEVTLPQELLPDGGKLNYKNFVTINCKDLCDASGKIGFLIQDRYVSKDEATWEDVEEAKEKKESIELYVLELDTGEHKWLVYPYDAAEVDFTDCLDYEKGFVVEDAR